MLHDDRLGRERERDGEVGAQVEDALRVAPHVHALAVPARQGA
jgi:hypothetical protein